MVLEARAIAAGDLDLDKEHQLAFAAAILKIPPIHLNLDKRGQPLVKRKGRVGNCNRPSEMPRIAFREPLVEGNPIECGIERIGPLYEKNSAEEKE